MTFGFGDKIHENNFRVEQGTIEYEITKSNIGKNYDTFVRSMEKSYKKYPIDANEFRSKINTDRDFRHFSFLPNCFRVCALASVLSGFSFDEFVSDIDWAIISLDRVSKCLSREGKHVLAGMGFDIFFEILIKLVQVERYQDPQIYKEDCRALEQGMKQNLKKRGYWPDDNFNQFRRYFDQMFDEYDPTIDSAATSLYINKLAAQYFGKEFRKPIDYLDRFFANVVYEGETWEIGREYRLQCYFYPFEDNLLQ